MQEGIANTNTHTRPLLTFMYIYVYMYDSDCIRDHVYVIERASLAFSSSVYILAVL